MTRLVLLVALSLFAIGIAVLAAPTASASACNPDFPGGEEVFCPLYDDVNRICSRKFGHPCFL
jgi:hypothetical protein